MRLAYFVRKYHLFILLGSFAFLLAGALLAPETAQAFASYLTAAVTKYPQINNSKLNECILCHTSNTNPKALNVYGSAFKNNGFNFDTIANLDSDGDGFTNIAEINALTFPGNRADFPQATAVPTATTPPLSPSNGCPNGHDSAHRYSNGDGNSSAHRHAFANGSDFTNRHPNTYHHSNPVYQWHSMSQNLHPCDDEIPSPDCSIH